MHRKTPVLEFLLHKALFNINFVKIRKNTCFVESCGWLHWAKNELFPSKDFFGKCDQIRRKLHLPKKFLMENFIFCAILLLSSLEMKGA